MTPKSGAKGLQMDSSNDKNQSTIDNMPALDQQMFSGGFLKTLVKDTRTKHVSK